MTEIILDASAILALLNQEPGADLVKQHLPHAKISSVNLAEVITRLNLIGMQDAEIQEVLHLLSLEVVPFDADQAFQTGILASQTRPSGLSLGDRACIALGILTNSPVLTADQAWLQISLPIEVLGIRD
ncbi:MAG: VapC toxin family PIN domain ribonuclease [Chloroflexi bacterium HGW-Chloroflexi-3]|nr:MAG: VapC toxin family PIN domain ribonuclease [Chloroflexi bacterium HGW-Chloroflexi-3]